MKDSRNSTHKSHAYVLMGKPHHRVIEMPEPNRVAGTAQVVKAETTVPLDWIAGRVDMGVRSTVSREIGAVEKE